MAEPIEQMGIFDVMYNCRAMRRIKPDEVPEELLVKLIEAATKGPTASNTQTSRWLILRDYEAKRKLADINRAAIDRSYPAPPADAPKSAFQWQYENLENIPALIIACVQLPREQPQQTFASGLGMGGSIWPLIQNLLLAARALGLGACPTTLPLADRTAAKSAMNLPDHIEPVCLIPVGYPKGKFGPVTRRPVEEIMRWDSWQS